jgi:hypothetical protein
MATAQPVGDALSPIHAVPLRCGAESRLAQLDARGAPSQAGQLGRRPGGTHTSRGSHQPLQGVAGSRLVRPSAWVRVGRSALAASATAWLGR